MNAPETFKRKNRRHTVRILVFCVGLTVVFIAGCLWIGIGDALRLSHSLSSLHDSVIQVKDDFIQYRYSKIFSELDIADQSLREAEEQIHTSPLFSFQFSPMHRYANEIVRRLELARVVLRDARVFFGMVVPIEKKVLNREGDGHMKQLTEQDKKEILDIIVRELPALTGANASLKLVRSRLAEITDRDVPRNIQDITEKFNQYTAIVSNILDRALPILSSVPRLIGHDKEVTYLLLFQNNAETRATGGFIGTYGTITLRNGDIRRFSTDNVYNLDDSAKTLAVSPPAPLRMYGGIQKWYLRDSNWAPDFKESARQAMWFYNHEGGNEKIDGVIALTPDVISSLMRIVGNISVDGLNFQPDQFYDQLQYQVEKGYESRGIPKQQRKDVIRLIADELLRRFHEMSISEWSQIEGVIKARLAEKSLLLYSEQPDIQEMIETLGWAGRIKQVESDYLMVVDSNIISLKTDAVMDKHIAYTLNEEDDGSLRARIELTYQNNGTYSWTSTTYRDYVRILIPDGSVIVSSSDELDISRVYGKMQLGRYISVDPQKKQSFAIDYRLPTSISTGLKKGLYALFVQKQSGVQNQQFKFDAHFRNPVVKVEPSQTYDSNLKGGAFNTSTTLVTDKSYEFSF